MSILQELNSLLTAILPVETGIFSGVPPDEYIVLTPMADVFALFGDDVPLIDVSEVRLSLFSKSNYVKRKNQITAALLGAAFTITDRRQWAYLRQLAFVRHIWGCSADFFCKSAI